MQRECCSSTGKEKSWLASWRVQQERMSTGLQIKWHHPGRTLWH